MYENLNVLNLFYTFDIPNFIINDRLWLNSTYLIYDKAKILKLQIIEIMRSE